MILRNNTTESSAGKSSPKFFRTLSLKKARSLIKSLPSQLTGSPADEIDIEIAVTSSALSETAHTVLNKINPFESSLLTSSTGSDSSFGNPNQSNRHRFLTKLEETFGLGENGEDEVFETDQIEENSIYYAKNQGEENKMLENLKTPDDEHTSLLMSTGSGKWFWSCLKHSVFYLTV